VVFDLFMSLVGSYAGRVCRRCSDRIDPRDEFAMSEAVCASCRR
jgi:hypothetical protein